MRILLVDDNDNVRRGIRSLLSSRPDFLVCGEAADGVQAIEMAKELHPDAVLMDISMPRMDGLQATRLIRAESPGTKIIIVSQNDPNVVRKQAREVEADGFVGKQDLSRDLLSVIHNLFDNTTDRGYNDQTSVAMPWLAGGGEMGSVMRSKDWSKTPLGSAESWSPALRMMVKFLLANRFPQLLWWGSEFCSLYNDAYAPILGAKHPWAIGQPVIKVWGEIWHVLKPLVETPFYGGPATWMEDIPLEINRRGFVEETHFTIAYSPVPDDTVPSGIGGVLATVHEITEKVVGERRILALRDLGARSVEPKSAEEACTIAAETLSRHSKDLPFVLLYLFDAQQELAHLVCGTGVDLADYGCPKVIGLASKPSEEVWPLSRSIEDEGIQCFPDLIDRFHKRPPGPWSDPPTSAAVVPIRSNVAHQPAGFMIVGISSRLQFDKNYRDFLELLSTQISTSVANARAYEEERKRAQALAEIDRAKTAFFSNVSHEFRTPLTLMLGPLHDLLSRSQTHLSSTAKEQLELVSRNGARLLRLVNTLLDFSRIEAGRVQALYQATDLTVFTSELASVFRSATDRAGLRLIVDCNDIGEPVYVDRDMWEKIVLNLISNAFKFTFEGEIVVSLRRFVDSAELRICDTGVGIPPDALPKLFERFHRVPNNRSRTHEGSGIGLALVQQLVRLHGGSIRVESYLGRGSTFIVTIPLGLDHLPQAQVGGNRTLASTASGPLSFVEEALRWLPDDQLAPTEQFHEEVLPVPCPSMSGVALGNRPLVIVADDNSDMRKYLARLLSERYEVQTFPNGETALAAARDRIPDLILSDVMMPGLDGIGLLREVRSDPTLIEVPTILLSARAGEESRLEGVESGADDYLIKPFSARELMARVEVHVKMHRLRQQVKVRQQQLALEYQTLINQAPLGIYLVDSEFRIRHVNPVASAMFGDIPQLIGRNFDDVIHILWAKDYADEIVRIFRHTLETGDPFAKPEHAERREDLGITEYYEWRIDRLILPDGNCVVCYFRDISAQVKARSAVTASEERYRNLAETLEQQVRLRTQQLEETNRDIIRQSEEVRNLSARLLQIQDQERRRIARDLHDSAGQTLAALGMGLSRLVRETQSVAPDASKKAAEIQEMVNHLSQEIRTTSYLLHPPLLEEAGLAAALRWYVDGLRQRSPLNVTLDIGEEFERLPEDMELVIFRIVQECLTNIYRHSDSKTAAIRVAREHNMITVEVQDHGRGMSADKLKEIQSRGSGVGIRGMSERVRQWNGTMNIVSDVSGTRILVSLPHTPSSEPQLQSRAETGALTAKEQHLSVPSKYHFVAQTVAQNHTDPAQEGPTVADNRTSNLLIPRAPIIER